MGSKNRSLKALAAEWLIVLLAFSPSAFSQTAQLRVLYSFPAAPEIPVGVLVPSYSNAGIYDPSVYGATSTGGTNGGFGTLYQIKTNGSFNSLYAFGLTNANPTGFFTPTYVSNSYYIGETFYGLTSAGGVGNSTTFTFSFLLGIGNGAISSTAYTGADQFEGGFSGATPSGPILGSPGYSTTSTGTFINGGSNRLGCIYQITNLQPIVQATFNGTNGANPYSFGSTGLGLNAAVNGGEYGLGELYTFALQGGIRASHVFSGLDGANPVCQMVILNHTYQIIGTTSNGGAYGFGTAFNESLYLFPWASFNQTNGANPCGALAVGPDNSVYGTTCRGGTNGGYGTVFRIDTNGLIHSLYSFDMTNGAYPLSGVVFGGDGALYGTTTGGLPGFDYGFAFRITTNGTLTNVHSFGGMALTGTSPLSRLAEGQDGGLYGTTSHGGSNGNFGTVFRATTNGALTSIFSFNGSNGSSPYSGVKQMSDGTLWGTTYGGGAFGDFGTTFHMTTNGVFLGGHSFNISDGVHPTAELALGSDGNLYGTTIAGGSLGYGTIFRLNSDGTFTSIFSFNQTNGEAPYGGLAAAPDGFLYGTTMTGDTNLNGAVSDYGTLYKISTNGSFSSIGRMPESFQNGNLVRYPYASITVGMDGALYGPAIGSKGYNQKIGFLGGPCGYFKASASGILSTNNFLVAGSNPFGTILQANDGNFYFPLSEGSSGNSGSIGLFSTTGQHFVCYFGTTNGATPIGGLIQARDGNFYGTTASGGAFGGGTIYQIPTYPVISTQPASTNGECGGATTLAVGATAVFQPMTYQWYCNGVLLTNDANTSGTTNAALVLSNLSQTQTGASYTVVISNSNGTVTSQPAVLSVADTTAPVIAINGLATTNIAVGAAYQDAGATAVDLCEGLVAVQTNILVDTSAPGIGSVNYSAADSTGNTTNALRTVNIIAAAPVQFQPQSDPFAYAFTTVTGQSYTIETSADLTDPNSWSAYTNVIGTGNPAQFVIPTNSASPQYFRVREP